MKFLTNAFQLITLATFFAGCLSEQSMQQRSRGMQDMGLTWRIGDAMFNWDKVKKEFQLGWEISDAVQDSQFSYKIFDNLDCNTENGGQDITESSNDVENGLYYLYTTGLTGSQDTGYDADSDGSGSRNTYLSLALQTKKLPDIPIWNDDDSQLNFCVRYMLTTGGASGIEVNFQEVLVQLDVELTDGFEVTGISVEPKKKDDNQANIECKVEGYICDENNELIAGGRLLNQGDEIRICVKTLPETREQGLWLSYIDFFYFYMDREGGLDQINQDAIVTGGNMSPMGLTLYNCQPGEDPCGFDNILNAAFYSAQGGTVRSVLGRGEAVCQIGSAFDSEAPSATPGTDDETEPPCIRRKLEDSSNILMTYEEPTVDYPAGTMSVVSTNGNTIDFKITQKWKTSDSVSWIAPMYVPPGSTTMTCNEADKREGVAYDGSTTYKAQCAADGKARVEVYVHDGSPAFKGASEVNPGCKGWGNDSGIATYKFTLSCGEPFTPPESDGPGTNDQETNEQETNEQETNEGVLIVDPVDPCEPPVDPELDGTPTAQPSLKPSVDPGFLIPTAEPDPDSCLVGPQNVWASDEEYSNLLDESFTITTYQTSSNKVDITITQNFAQKIGNDKNINWLAVMYPSLPSGSNECLRSGVDPDDGQGNSNGWGQDGDELTITTLCTDGIADPLRVYLELYIFDSKLKDQLDIPEQCRTGATATGQYKKNLGLKLYVPCTPCATQRDLRKAMIRNGDLPAEAALDEISSDSKSLKNNASVAHLQQMARRRKMQDEEEASENPSSPPFELQFEINTSPDGFQARSSAPAMMMATAATFLSLFWGSLLLIA